MNVFKNIKLKNKVSKGSMAFFLFFFLLVSPHNVSSSFSRQAFVTQTELISGIKNQNHKGVVSFNKVVTGTFLLNQNSPIYHPGTFQVFNRSIHVKFTAISKHIGTFQIAVRFLQIKTIPESSDEDNLSSLIG
jgi:hypothetical protein